MAVVYAVDFAIILIAALFVLFVIGAFLTGCGGVDSAESKADSQYSPDEFHYLCTADTHCYSILCNEYSSPPCFDLSDQPTQSDMRDWLDQTAPPLVSPENESLGNAP